MSVLRYGVVLIGILAIAWPAVPPRALPGLAGSEWRVMEVGGAKVPGPATVRFTQTSVRGTAACHAYSGAFRESHGRIEIAGLIPAADLAEIAKPCRGQIGMERSFLESLARAVAYKIDGGILMLMDIHGKALARLSD